MYVCLERLSITNVYLCLGDIRLPVYFYLQVGSISTRFSHVSFFRCGSSLKVPTLYKWPCRYTFIQMCQNSTRYLNVYVIIVIRLSISDRHFFRWFTFFELLLCLKINSEFAKNEYVRITVTCGNGYFSVVLWISPHILTELSWYEKSLYELYSHKKFKNVLKDFLFLTQNYHQTFLCLLDIHVIEKHMHLKK